MKLNNQLTDNMADAIKDGSTIQGACDCLGIAKQSYYNWLKRAEEILMVMEAEQREAAKDSEEPYLYFRKKIGEAHNDYRMELVSVIQEQAKTHWQAAAWILERRYPQDYGRQQIGVDDSLRKKNDSPESRDPEQTREQTPQDEQENKAARRMELEARFRQENGSS